jgi:hypothetical protein
MSIREEMPLLARHEGEWRGTYIFLDPDANVIDRHECHLTHTFPEEGEVSYFQTNDYRWPDGRTEHIEFPATYKDGRIWFDTERINGYAWEVDEQTIVLHWRYVADASVYLYEMIQLDASGNHRTRTWHWFKDGVCFQRTLVAEERVG